MLIPDGVSVISYSILPTGKMTYGINELFPVSSFNTLLFGVSLNIRIYFLLELKLEYLELSLVLILFDRHSVIQTDQIVEDLLAQVIK